MIFQLKVSLRTLKIVINNDLLNFKIGNVMDSELVDELVKKNDIILHLACCCWGHKACNE